jgi:hypothetical protein
MYYIGTMASSLGVFEEGKFVAFHFVNARRRGDRELHLESSQRDSSNEPSLWGNRSRPDTETPC